MAPQIGTAGSGGAKLAWRPGMLPPPSATPVLTVYALPDGRVELSGTTLGNWVAKAANLLMLDEGLEPGDVVHVDLSPDWDVAMWCQAAWVAGATVSLPPRQPTGAALLITRDDGPALPTLVSDVNLLNSPQSTGSADAEETAGRLRAQPDVLVLPAPGLVPDQVAITWGGTEESQTADQACAGAARWASDASLSRGDRVVMTSSDPAPVADTREFEARTIAVLPLNPGIAVVLVRMSADGAPAATTGSELDASTLRRIADQERATIHLR